MTRSLRIAIIGAGSAEFAAELMTDILCTPALESGTFALVDIDPERLALAGEMGRFLIDRTGRDWTVETSTDRAELLPGCGYVINTIEVAGLDNVRHDYDIPMKYGVDQCIGDTIGPGGLFKALRTLPVWVDIVRDVERLAPEALILNYTNPMSVTVLTGLRAASMPIVGLCHSVSHTVEQLADYLDVPKSELRWRAAGVNHLSFITELTRNGDDLYPALRAAGRRPEIYEQDPVRFETLYQLGAFVAESSGHNSEYTQWFRKRPDLVERYTRGGYVGESGFYANNWPTWRREADERLRRVIAGAEQHELVRGDEYASRLIEARETGEPVDIYVNVLNDGLIDNLPSDGVVEVAATVDASGVHAHRFGRLPSQFAAPVAAHMAFHDLLATSVLERDRESAVQALMVDPLTSAVCSLAEIRAMFDEMVAAERASLPAYVVDADFGPR
jgi:alpha-galactosidase